MKKALIVILSILMCIVVDASADGVAVPAGAYIVGEDIPAGYYSVMLGNSGSNISTWLNVWGAKVEDYQTNGGLLNNILINSDNPIVGKVMIEDGTVVEFKTELVFSPYEPIEFDPDGTVMPPGEYIVGEDIPEGYYTVSLENTNDSTWLNVWGARVGDYQTNGGLLYDTLLYGDAPIVGKVSLTEGTIVDIKSKLAFKTYEQTEFDPVGTIMPSGAYIVGEDIPSGYYTVTLGKESANNSTWLYVWGANVNDYDTNGGLIINILMNNDNPIVGKIMLVDGTVVNFDTELLFNAYEPIEFDPDGTIFPAGIYIVGEDIPEGYYTVSMDNSNGSNSTWLYVWGANVNDYDTNGGLINNILLEKGNNEVIGKLTLEEGNVLSLESALTFKEYQGISFD